MTSDMTDETSAMIVVTFAETSANSIAIVASSFETIARETTGTCVVTVVRSAKTCANSVETAVTFVEIAAMSAGTATITGAIAAKLV